MEEQKEEVECIGDCKAPMEEAGKGLVLPSQTESVDGTALGEFDVPQEESCIEDGNTEKQLKADVGSVEDIIAIVNDEESNDVKRTDAITEAETERNEMECDRDAGTVEVNQVEARDGFEHCKDLQQVDESKSKIGESHESAGEEETVTSSGKAKFEAEDNGGDCDAEQSLESDKHSDSAQVPEESTQLSRGESNKENLGTVTEVSPAAEISHEDEITNFNQKEEIEEAMEIDYVAEEHVGKDVTIGEVSDNVGIVSAGESMVQTQDIPKSEADKNDSNCVKEMEIDERKDNADMVSDLTETIVSADSANTNNPSEDASPGEVESLDHHVLFDPSYDITNFIDFSGVSSWSGNIKDLKTETGNVSLKEDMKATDMAEEVTSVDGKEALKSVEATINSESHDAAIECSEEASDATLGSEQNQEDKDHQCLDKKTEDQHGTMIEEDDITHEAPNIDSNQKEDTEMEENSTHYDYVDDETGFNGVKRKADVLSEDSPGEGKRTVSLAKVSFVQMHSFKIGACIARAASQMASSPSVLKGSIFDGETLSVESFVFQLHCAATDPVKENGVSDIAVGFFLDYRNSLVSQQVNIEKVSSKRFKTSNSNAGGTEAFEFEEMGDTYWTDKVIHNGGEEQTPTTENGTYQIVPVEVKPIQLQRTRRPYRRRQPRINIPLHSALEKPVDLDENAPAELIMNFSETDTIPLEKNLSKMFRHFGPIIELQTEVDRDNNRARVVFKKGADAKVAYNSAGRFNIFGTKAVSYELSHTITETFRVQPYIVSLGEEDAALCLPS